MKSLQPFDISFSGINLVEASAGTGKTYNITSLFIRALIELEIPVRNILVVTYTDAATKELKDRLLKRIRESITVLKTNHTADRDDQFLKQLSDHVNDRLRVIEKLERAVRTFDEAAIYTIHGFCYQALQEQAFESGAMYGAEITVDDSDLVLEAVDDYWRSWVGKAATDKLKRPLLKYLLEKGYSPDSLAEELRSYIGQPFLEIHPQQTPSFKEIQDYAHTLYELFDEMKNCWEGEGQTILSLFKADQLNGNKYPKKSVQSWIQTMDEFLSGEVPSIVLFDKFEKFRPSVLNDSLNKGKTEVPEHPFFDLAGRYAQTAQALRHFDVIFKKQLLLYLRKEVRTKKEHLQLLSYDDLLLQLQEALQAGEKGKRLAEELRKKYPLGLVDEFQDTDPSQYDIFRRIYAPDTDRSALFMIGDPKQSIYSFRGADVFSYLKAKRDAPKEQTYSLDRNFRSTPGLIKGINILFGEHSKPFILDEISFEKVSWGRDEESYDKLIEKGNKQPPIRFRRLADERDQLNKSTAAERVARDTAMEISRLIDEGKKGHATIGAEPVKARDIAVLVRKHKQARMISEALRERGIKSVQYSQDSVFDSEEAHHLEIFLKAVAEPGNEGRVKTALSLSLTPYTANDLLNIEEDEDQWLGILDQFAHWHRLWQQQGFSAMFRLALKEAHISEHLITYPDGERRLTNILHLGELLQAEAQHQKDGMRGLLKWLSRKRKEGRAKQDEEQLRLESDRELVKIVTMHRSKGLEYPIVFCPFLWYGPRYQDRGQPLVYHDPTYLDKMYLDLSGKTDSDRDRKRLLMAREELAESLRLAYVAITRAKQCCYLTWAYAQKSEFSALGYLFLGYEVCTDLLEQTIRKKYKSIGKESFDQAIQQLCDSYSHLFTMEYGSRVENQQLELLDIEEQPKLKSRTFRGRIPIEPSYHVSSFSSLTSWMGDDPYIPDYDQYLDDTTRGAVTNSDFQELNMFTFPKGPQPGTCIHKIFEDTDFSDVGDLDERITKNLMAYGIDSQWDSAVADMVRGVWKYHFWNRKKS